MECLGDLPTQIIKKKHFRCCAHDSAYFFIRFPLKSQDVNWVNWDRRTVWVLVLGQGVGQVSQLKWPQMSILVMDLFQDFHFVLRQFINLRGTLDERHLAIVSFCDVLVPLGAFIPRVFRLSPLGKVIYSAEYGAVRHGDHSISRDRVSRFKKGESVRQVEKLQQRHQIEVTAVELDHIGSRLRCLPNVEEEPQCQLQVIHLPGSIIASLTTIFHNVNRKKDGPYNSMA